MAVEPQNVKSSCSCDTLRPQPLKLPQLATVSPNPFFSACLFVVVASAQVLYETRIARMALDRPLFSLDGPIAACVWTDICKAGSCRLGALGRFPPPKIPFRSIGIHCALLFLAKALHAACNSSCLYLYCIHTHRSDGDFSFRSRSSSCREVVAVVLVVATTERFSHLETFGLEGHQHQHSVCR